MFLIQKNNNNRSAITSQFEEDDFLSFEKMFSPFLMMRMELHVFLNVLLVLNSTLAYLMEAEICLR